MGRYYQEHKHKVGGRGKSRRNYNRFSAGARGGSGKGKILVFGLAVIVLCAVLWQTNLISFGGEGGLKSVPTAVKNSFNQAVAWGGAKLGFNNNEFVLPVSSGVVVQDYGVVKDENGEESYHSGVDIQVPAGSEVLAAESGEVIAVDTREDATFWVTVNHNSGWATVYGRLGEVQVAVGDKVEKGAVLGTPQSETLHFEVLEDGTQKNPIHYFQTK